MNFFENPSIDYKRRVLKELVSEMIRIRPHGIDGRSLFDEDYLHYLINNRLDDEWIEYLWQHELKKCLKKAKLTQMLILEYMIFRKQLYTITTIPEGMETIKKIFVIKSDKSFKESVKEAQSKVTSINEIPLFFSNKIGEA